MGHALAANTNVANGDAVVGADDPARRWGWDWPYDGRLDDAGGRKGPLRRRRFS